MDLRIGIAQSPQTIELELSDDTDREQLKKQIGDAVQGKDAVLWLIDRKGKELAVPASTISFVEISAESSERRIGFGA